MVREKVFGRLETQVDRLRDQVDKLPITSNTVGDGSTEADHKSVSTSEILLEDTTE